MDQPRSTQRYERRKKTDEPVLSRRLRELVRLRPRFGYRRLTALLRSEGWKVNAKRVHRLCRQEGLKVGKVQRKRRAVGCSRNGCQARKAEHRDDVWTWDFVFDRTVSGTVLKWLSLVDEYTRECLVLKVDRRIMSEDVIDTLAELFARRGVPKAIRSDNGPEFIAKAIRQWLGCPGIQTLSIAPGSPWENGYAESFHSKLRDEFLSREIFENIASARKLTASWKEDYNHHRPHSSLDYQTPAAFAARCATSTPERPAATPAFQPHSDLTNPELS